MTSAGTDCSCIAAAGHTQESGSAFDIFIFPHTCQKLDRFFGNLNKPMKSRIDKMRFSLGKQKQMTMEAEKILKKWATMVPRTSTRHPPPPPGKGRNRLPFNGLFCGKIMKNYYPEKNNICVLWSFQRWSKGNIMCLYFMVGLVQLANNERSNTLLRIYLLFAIFGSVFIKLGQWLNDGSSS